jgi:hypothetical protein
MSDKLLDWPAVRNLPWRERNAAVETSLRIYLNTRPASRPALLTRELAQELAGVPHGTLPSVLSTVALTSVLSTMAPHIGEPYAFHDGPVFYAYGKKFRKWTWKGTAHG